MSDCVVCDLHSYTSIRQYSLRSYVLISTVDNWISISLLYINLWPCRIYTRILCNIWILWLCCIASIVSYLYSWHTYWKSYLLMSVRSPITVCVTSHIPGATLGKPIGYHQFCCLSLSLSEPKKYFQQIIYNNNSDSYIIFI